MNYGRAYSPPREGGVSAPSKNGSVPKTARTGWSLTSYVSKCVLKHWLVSDHPVCGASVAARLFIDAAATPPLQGRECAPLNSSTIHSHLHRAPLQFESRYSVASLFQMEYAIQTTPSSIPCGNPNSNRLKTSSTVSLRFLIALFIPIQTVRANCCLSKSASEM